MSNMARERCPGINPAKGAGRVKKEERTQKEEDSRKEEHIIEGGRKLFREKPAEKMVEERHYAPGSPCLHKDDPGSSGYLSLYTLDRFGDFI